LLRLADDIAATDSIKTPSGKGLRDAELQMAARLVDGFAGPWKPEQYKDQYAANLAAIIRAKMKGKGAKPRLGAIGPAEPTGEVTDLMERLRATLAANTNARSKAGGATATATKAKAKRSAAPARRRAVGKHRRAA
jgi:DNA end-binding protein Ku